MHNYHNPEIVNAEVVAESSATSPPKSGWRPAWKVVGVIALLVLGYFGFVLTMQDKATEVAGMVRGHPIVIDKLGGITESKHNFLASKKRAQVYDVRGPKGKAQLVTRESFVKIRSITLKTPDGEWKVFDGEDKIHLK